MGEKHTIARLERNDMHFEILVRPEKALLYRMEKLSSIAEVLVTETVFSDANKGMKVSDGSLIKVFGTVEPLRVAETILKKGTMSQFYAKTKILTGTIGETK